MTTLGPRLVVAGTHSGVGKTTIATGLMVALRRAGHTVASAKVGPDFIDPGYHSLATGRPPRNLDAWMSGLELIGPLAARAGTDADITIIEGVMGLFDGANDGSPSSTADIAIELDAPVALVVDGSSMSSSVAALVQGYRDHRPELRFAGVILNRVSTERHRTLLIEALAAIDVPVLGTIARDDAMTWRDRHLGLVPVDEQPDEVRASLERLGGAVGDGCDLERVMAIATAAPGRTVDAPQTPAPGSPVPIAVAGGPAFTFQYRDNIEALQAAGAELLPFDPLVDEHLPDGVAGLIIGGGFPEVFAPRLADNRRLLDEVAHAVGDGLITWAECGGLLWLSRSLDDRSMAGVIPARTTMSDRLTLGYRTATAATDTPLALAGSVLRGHEFHYSVCEPGGDALQLTSRFDMRSEGFGSPTMLATYLHQHLAAAPERAERFVQSCREADRHR
ncbi:MAG: cobyrinate a,c-diamide synthase [Actinomycetota bacterium]